ncbi:MAG: ATP-binding cassette domain-containing protein [Hyphomicrobiaceae bacterium]|nr:ATP-binding cassette domain-containing protein [Hyphomicrobiaceae bacterium]
MNDVVIRAEGLGKTYLIGHETERERYTALRDVIGRTAKSLLRSAGDMIRGRQLVAGDEVEEIWALKDVSFEIRRGEVVGIIGRNGAGKSTLLKILSRITEPSAGRVEIRGRVASLLEVGTGFHPELTGRENIYLNGAILGMTRAEIRRKFDEIVDFAGVEKFLDTPVKRYSSGMYVRLAFAVAAHLEPEILVVDEVLAVGDAEFQRKCLGKMGEVARGGRTVLFVSHNMGAVASLCQRAILLNRGTLHTQGDVSPVLSAYINRRESAAKLAGRQIDVAAELLKRELAGGDAVVIKFRVTLRGPLTEPRIGIGIDDDTGARIATLFSETSAPIPRIEHRNSLQLLIETEPVRIRPGMLSIKIALANCGQDIETYEHAIQVVVPDYSPFARPPYARPRGGVLLKSRMDIDEEAHQVFV